MINTLNRDFKRLGLLFASTYVVAAILLVGTLLYAYHAQQIRLARSFALASRHSLILRDLRQTVNSIKPALAEGFSAVSLSTPGGGVVFTIPYNSAINDIASLMDLKIPIAITTNSSDPSAPDLATVVFYYNIRGVFLGTIGAAFFLFIIFVYLFQRSRHQVEERHQVMMEKRRAETVHEIAQQVSHDIRSPVSALNMVVATLDAVPEDKHLLLKQAIQRINDIANSLLQSRAQASEAPSALSSEIVTDTISLNASSDPTMLMTIVDTIVSEKRIQYSGREDIEIQADLSKGFGLFAKIDPIELGRALSNLINNSVEALTAGGKVTVCLRKFGKNVAIIIQDNGKGMPPDILQFLGEKGFSYGKSGAESGSGLGLHHAKKVTERAGGRFQIQSKVGEGTIITISLPTTPAPN